MSAKEIALPGGSTARDFWFGMWGKLTIHLEPDLNDTGTRHCQLDDLEAELHGQLREEFEFVEDNARGRHFCVVEFCLAPSRTFKAGSREVEGCYSPIFV